MTVVSPTDGLLEVCTVKEERSAQNMLERRVIFQSGMMNCCPTLKNIFSAYGTEEEATQISCPKNRFFSFPQTPEEITQ